MLHLNIHYCTIEKIYFCNVTETIFSCSIETVEVINPDGSKVVYPVS